MTRIGALAIGTLLLAACGNELGPLEPRWEIGRWEVRASYAGGTVQCRVEATLEFASDGAMDSYRENRVDCTDSRVPFTVPLQTYTVVHSLENRSISFVPYQDADPATAPCAVLRFVGSMRAETMAGMVYTMPWNCGTYLEMQGTWVASRVAGP